MLLAGSACEAGGKRPLGAACEAASECESGLCANGTCVDPAGDDDQDGVLNAVELAVGTNLFNADSDGDGAEDGSEIGANPNLPPDSDGDGVSDALESALADADGDCLADQFDASDGDEGHAHALEVCQRVGLCATHTDSLSATCEVIDGAPLWTCDPSAVPGYDVSDTACDGVDEDCDGETDEEFVGEDVPCALGSCTATARERCSDGAITSTCVAEAASDDATCDGVDDDCDGQTDDEVVVVASECGVGACAASGTVVCNAGALIDDCVVVDAALDDSVCNGEDDDCDGATDEDASREVSCGEGACRAQGFAVCSDGEASLDCVPLDVAATDDATCDGVDGDCDGESDEDFVVSETACGVGGCLRGGLAACVAGAVTDSCVPGGAAADDATCDGFDDDCNGVADEDFVVTVTTCGVGACGATGARTCGEGRVADSCLELAPAANDDATCDGVDDDCDALTDEDSVPIAMTCGLGACSRAGLLVCDFGGFVEDCQVGTPTTSEDVACDGVDDDCNGVTDEGFVAVPTACGTGACAGSGVTTCSSGVTGDSCAAGSGEARDEDCDGIDDDCDEATDEDYVPPVTSCGIGGCGRTGLLVCSGGATRDTCLAGAPAASDVTCDGVDDDCDEATDESYPGTGTACGVGRCASQGAMRCVEGDPVDSCQPLPADCTGRQCGSDGCAGSCGTCPAPAASCLSVACNGGGQCATSVNAGFCYIGQACIANGAANPGNDCQYCDAVLDATGWSPYKRGNLCGDEGNTCTSDSCDGLGTCGHPVLPDLTACNDSDAATVGDWCVSAACRGFFSKVEPKVSPQAQAQYFEGYRRGNVGPVTPSVQGAFYYTDTQGNDRAGVTHYTTGPAILPVVLNTGSSLVALDGTRIVHVDTLWEYAGSKWLNTRDVGTLRLVWGGVGNEFPPTFERLIRYSATLTSYALGAGRTNNNGGLIVRQCSVSQVIAGSTWSCNGQTVFTGDFVDSYPAKVVRAGGVNYVFANYGSRTSPTSLKVLKYTNASWRSDALLTKTASGELRDVVYSGGWFIGVGASNTLWVTKLAGYFDIALTPGTTYSWQQAVVWRGNVVVLGQVGSLSTTVVLAWCPLDDFLSNATRWQVHTLWTGQTLLATSLIAPNDNELYVLGADRLGSTALSPTVRALWRYTTGGVAIP